MSMRTVLAIVFWGSVGSTAGPTWIEPAATSAYETAEPLGQVDAALSRGDVPAARRAWHRAYLEALGSRAWSPMIVVGDAWLRIGAASGGTLDARPNARDQYLRAFFRARHQGSLDGVLRAAEAFAGLGDREVVEQIQRAAGEVAARRRHVNAARSQP